MRNTHQNEYKDKWYRNLSTMTLNTLANHDILEDPEKVKELCLNREIRKFRNCGKVMFAQICIALGITVSSKTSNLYCPHCNKSFVVQLHKLKTSSEVELK